MANLATYTDTSGALALGQKEDHLPAVAVLDAAVVPHGADLDSPIASLGSMNRNALRLPEVQ